MFEPCRFTYMWIFSINTIQFSSVTQLCPTICETMDCSMPGFPVHHQLPELTQTHVHRVGDAIKPSHPLSSLLLLPSILPNIRVFSIESVMPSNHLILCHPFLPCPQSFPASGSFQMSQLLKSGGQSTGVLPSTSVLPMNTQD